MITRATFDRIKQRRGAYASWAVWAEASGKPKSNVSDMRVLDPDANSDLLEILKNDVLMIGLNISRSFSEPFRNFHDTSPKSNDFKIRHAFANTIYYGAYMTDIVKNVEMIESARHVCYLKENPSVIDANVRTLLDEIEDLRCDRPTILAFGSVVHQLIARNLSPTAYSRLVRLTHYSCRMEKEKYRQAVLGQLGGL